MELQPRFFVTGSTGFIGRRLVDRLLSDFGPQSIVCLVRPATTALETRALESQRAAGIRLIEGDLLNDPVSADLPPAASILFHLGANIDTSATADQLRVNDQGTENLLRWIGRERPAVRVVYASSVAVHDRDRRPVAPITEESPCVPRTAYGRSKLRGETVVRDFGASGRNPWTIVRLPTVYGPGQKPSGLIATLARLSARQTWLCRLDWPGRTSIIHVDDAVDAMIELGTRPDTAGHVFGIASDESLTVGEIARHVAEAQGAEHVPLVVSRAMWSAAQSLVWNKGIRAVIQPFESLAYWRLSLILTDGFWVDTTKFRRVYSKPLRTLSEGLVDTLSPIRRAPGSRVTTGTV